MMTKTEQKLLQIGFRHGFPAQTLGNQWMHGIAAVILLQPALIHQNGQIIFQIAAILEKLWKIIQQHIDLVAVTRQQGE